MSQVHDQPTPPIVVFAAMRWECRPVLRALQEVRRDQIEGLTVWRGRSRRAEVMVVKTGIGPQLARRGVDAIVTARRNDPAALAFVSTGCAGGLGANTRPGHVALATVAVDGRDGASFAADAAWIDVADAVARGAGLHVHRGSVLCVDQALATVADKGAAAAAGHVAVEMEGAAIAAGAARVGVPYLSVRTILDDAQTELAGSAPFLDPQNGTVRPLALAKHLLAHPTAVGELRAMQRLMQAAESSLERFYQAWLSTDGAGLSPRAVME